MIWAAIHIPCIGVNVNSYCMIDSFVSIFIPPMKHMYLRNLLSYERTSSEEHNPPLRLQDRFLWYITEHLYTQQWKNWAIGIKQSSYLQNLTTSLIFSSSCRKAGNLSVMKDNCDFSSFNWLMVSFKSY